MHKTPQLTSNYIDTAQLTWNDAAPQHWTFPFPLAHLSPSLMSPLAITHRIRLLWQHSTSTPFGVERFTQHPLSLLFSACLEKNLLILNHYCNSFVMWDDAELYLCKTWISDSRKEIHVLWSPILYLCLLERGLCSEQSYVNDSPLFLMLPVSKVYLICVRHVFV